MTEPVTADRWADLRQFARNCRAKGWKAGAEIDAALAENAQLVETIRELEIRAADKDAQRVAEREARLEAQREHTESCATTDQWRDQRDRADAAEARAEQAERQVRAGLALADEWRQRSDEADVRASRGDRYADTRRLIYERVESELRAAMSGVSGPTTEGASDE